MVYVMWSMASMMVNVCPLPCPTPLLTPTIPSSEHDPDATMLLMELAKEAGLPDGVCNVIHGQHDG